MSELTILENELEDIKKTISSNPGMFIIAIKILEARQVLEKIKVLKEFQN